MHHMEMSTLSPNEKRLPSKRQSPKYDTAIHFCRICQKRIEDNSWRSVCFGGDHICQDCFYSLKPVYKPHCFSGISGFAIYEKTKQLDGVLHRFLEKGEENLGPSLLSYIKAAFYLRYKNYTIVSFPEEGLDPAFDPAFAIFSPFGFKVINPLKEVVYEKDNNVLMTYKLSSEIKGAKKVILFSCRPSPVLLKKAKKTFVEANVKIEFYLTLCPFE